jgi:RNA polymerase sigma-70 factor (family 1)
MHKVQFSQSVMVHKNKMYRFALSFLSSAEEAQDVVQDVLLKLWEGRESLHRVQNLEAWCMTLTRNKSLDRLKRASHRLRVSTADGNPDEQRHAHNDHPEQALSNKELGHMIKAAMDSLPEKQKATFHLRDVQGYSYIEIGEMLEMDINQVKVNIHRARKALQQRLQYAVSNEQ